MIESIEIQMKDTDILLILEICTMTHFPHLPRRKRRHGRDKHKSGGISLQDDTEMISEDDNVEADNKIEDMMKDAVAISDDEIALDKSKGSDIDNVKVEVKDEYIEEGECKDNNVIIKDLLNS